MEAPHRVLPSLVPGRAWHPVQQAAFEEQLETGAVLVLSGRPLARGERPVPASAGGKRAYCVAKSFQEASPLSLFVLIL